MKEQEIDSLIKFIEQRRKQRDLEVTEESIRTLVDEMYPQESTKFRQRVVNEYINHQTSKKMIRYITGGLAGLIIGGLGGGWAGYHILEAQRDTEGRGYNDLIENLKSDLDSANQEIDGLVKTIAKKEDEFTESQSEMADKNQQIQDLKDEIERLQEPRSPESNGEQPGVTPNLETSYSFSQDGITVDMFGCQTKNQNNDFKEIICPVRLTNDSDYNVLGIGASSDYFISSGSNFKLGKVKLGNSREDRNSIRQEIPKGQYLNGYIEFESIPNQVQVIDYLEFTVFYVPSYTSRNITVKFENVPVDG
ncbi:MAG: coiled-coil domain-containing protein [Geitlerinemataceae cyanobacterium]